MSVFLLGCVIVDPIFVEVGQSKVLVTMIHQLDLSYLLLNNNSLRIGEFYVF